MSIIRSLVFVSYVIVFMLFSSCGGKKANKDSALHIDSLSRAGTGLKYALGFDINKKGNYTLITIRLPDDTSEILQRFVLYSGDTVPLSPHEGLIAVHVPVKRIAVASLDNIGFLSLLRCDTLLVAVTDADRLYNRKVRKALQEGRVADLGPAVGLNTEKLLMATPDIVLATSYNSADKHDYGKTGLPFVYNLDWMEISPLGRAEWIKLVAEFTDTRARADSVFRKIEENYLSLKHEIDGVEPKPSVIIGANYKDVWYMPAGNSFKALLLRDAGAYYFYSKERGTGSLSLSFESVVKNAHSADFWLEVPYASYMELLSADSRYGVFDAVKNKKVYNNYGRVSGMANDYWESGMCRPDLILRDLAAILHPDKFHFKPVYYKKLSDE